MLTLWCKVTILITGRTEITHPKVQPVYIKSGDTLELICEHDDPFSLQWSLSSVAESPRQYVKIDTSSESGYYMTSLVKDGRGWTNLTKSNVSSADAGSYRCSLVSRPDRAYAVDVVVLLGEFYCMPVVFHHLRWYLNSG